MAVEQRTYIAREKHLYLMGCSSNEHVGLRETLEVVKGQAESPVRCHAIEEIVVFAALVEPRPSFHRMLSNSLVEVLPVAALPNAGDQRLLDDQEWQLSL